MERPTVSISLEQKVNLGNYESAALFMSVSGLGMDATIDEIEALLDGPGRLAYSTLAQRMRGRIAAMRGGDDVD